MPPYESEQERPPSPGRVVDQLDSPKNEEDGAEKRHDCSEYCSCVTLPLLLAEEVQDDLQEQQTTHPHRNGKH